MEGWASPLREVDIHVDGAAASCHGVVPSTTTTTTTTSSGESSTLDMKVNIINDRMTIEMGMMIIIMIMRMDEEILWGRIFVNLEELLMILFLMSIIRCIFRLRTPFFRCCCITFILFWLPS